MLFLLLLVLVLTKGTITPLNNAKLYMEVFGDVTYLPSNCSSSCEGKCLECNLRTLTDCSFTDFLKIRNGSVGFFNTLPNKACQRERLYIYNPGEYKLTINKLGKYLQFIPFKVNNANYLSVDFVLGYEIS